MQTIEIKKKIVTIVYKKFKIMLCKQINKSCYE